MLRKLFPCLTDMDIDFLFLLVCTHCHAVHFSIFWSRATITFIKTAIQSTICAALKDSVVIRCESSIPTATPVKGTIQLELLQAFRRQRQLPVSYILINLDLSNYEVLCLPCQGHGTCLWNYLGATGSAFVLPNTFPYFVSHLVFAVVVIVVVADSFTN
jgi:hypothetical protein